MRKQNNN